MKIGILTFHWGTNHGAILQTYASYKYLKNLGHDVQIINYFPKKYEVRFKSLFRPNYPSVMIQRIFTFIKERRLRDFRKNLNLTKRYYSNQELIDNPPEFDMMLCGSDQIWNPFYVSHGENKTTTVYFLNFGNEKCKKAALSVSFGCEKYPKLAGHIIRPYIEELDCISVRENSGKKILEEMGIENVFVTADPCSLISKEEYLDICKDIPVNKTKYIASCILRKQGKDTRKLINDIVIKSGAKKTKNLINLSMEAWLGGMRDASAVVTNSFHCVMMCLKLHIPFWVVLEKGTRSGMNDRMYTLLEKVGLLERIVIDISILDSNSIIEWQKVDEKMDKYTQSLKTYLHALTQNDEEFEKSKILATKNKTTVEHIEAFAAKAKDCNIQKNSSSGGIFTVLAEYIIDSKGVVFGAAMADDCKSVKHIPIDNKYDLYRLRGSKYIQSDMNGVYANVLTYLEKNKPVLFTGTPCQIAGLRVFLKKDYDNLYCQDVVCHGTPLSCAWKSYADGLEHRNKSTLESVSFRDKRKGWLAYSVVYKFANGKEIIRPTYKDPYMRGFLSNIFLKKSCSECKFKGNGSCSDIMLADYWGIQKIHPQFFDKNGVSLVVIKTKKGKELFDAVKERIECINTDLEKAIIYNSSMIDSAKEHPKRDEFLSDLKYSSFSKLIKIYCKVGFKVHIKRIIKRIYKAVSKNGG